MKVALVSEHANPLAAVGGEDAGGQNVHVAALAEALASRGHHVAVHTRRDDEASPAVVRTPGGVEVHHVDAGPARPLGKDELLPHMPAFAARLRPMWETSPPDVVHAHFWMSALASLDAASASRVPVVVTFHALGAVKRRHQGAADPSPPEREDTERRIGRKAACVVATCTDEVAELRGLGVPAEHVRIVPCGVDVAAFAPVGPSAPSAGRRRVLAIGRLVPRKGVADAIVALTQVPDAELVVVGGPPARDLDGDVEATRLRCLAREMSVEHRVELRGRLARDEVPSLIRSADVVVCAPWYEPFGMVPLEALACGVPVVGTAVGGLLDTVHHEVTGLLTPPRRPDLLALAIRRALSDDRLRARARRVGPDRARARYAWNRVAATHEAIYRSVTGSRRVVIAG